MDPDQLSQFLNLQSNQETSRRDLQSHRDRIRDLIRQTSTCDGSNTPNVRLWIKEIGLAYDDVGQAHIIQIVNNTITGNLRFEVARFLSESANTHGVRRETVPWDALKNHVTTQFLNTDETQSLRDELDHIRQSPYDTIPQYSRKFRELADSAYPTRPRNADQALTLVRAFARGLTSNDMARKLIENIVPPITLEAAIALVAQYNERHDAYDRLRRQEVPMEIGSLDLKGKSPAPTGLDNLTKMVERLSTKLAKLEVSTRKPDSAEVSRNNYQHAHNRPRQADVYYNNRQRVDVPSVQPHRLCFNCNLPGHIARDCRRPYTPRVASNNNVYDRSNQRQSFRPQQRVSKSSNQGNGQPL